MKLPTTIEIAPTAPRMSFNEALLYCQFLEYRGYKDWRLPTFNECVELGSIGWSTNDREDNKSKHTVVPVRDV